MFPAPADPAGHALARPDSHGPAASGNDSIYENGTTTLHPYRWHVRRKCAYAWDKEKNPVKRGTLFQRMSSLQRAKRYVKNHRQCIPGNRK